MPTGFATACNSANQPYDSLQLLMSLYVSKVSKMNGLWGDWTLNIGQLYNIRSML